MHFGFGGHGNQAQPHGAPPPPHGAPDPAHGMYGNDPGMGHPMNPSMQQANGIMQSLSWKLLFFAGALAVFSTAVIAILYFIFDPQWAPCSFTSELFLLIFGIIMMVIDFPIPHQSQALLKFRYSIFKFLLFMTRFTGRGLWYLFLATMCFQALWDFDICKWLGFVICGLLVVLGAASLYKGYTLSKKLDQVRVHLMSSGKHADSYFPPQYDHLSHDQFALIIKTATGVENTFSPEEMGYITNALSFTAKDDGTIDKDELRFWLSDGGHMLLV